MLENITHWKPIENPNCQKCNDTWREKNWKTVKGIKAQFICSCKAWDKEAKKRTEKKERTT